MWKDCGVIPDQMRADLDKRADQVQAMFDRVAPRYDLMNNLLAPGQVPAWRKETTRAIRPKSGERVLDLAAGTGSSSVPLAESGADVVCCDLSLGMLTEGRRRHPELPFVNGDALRLPFADGTFDAVTISFGLRNVHDTAAALAELRRVTRKGGRVVVCEFSTPTWAPFRRVYRSFLKTALPAVASIASTNAPAYRYLAESINAWPDQVSLGRLMADAGWHRVEWKNLTGGVVALHRGWN